MTIGIFDVIFIIIIFQLIVFTSFLIFRKKRLDSNYLLAIFLFAQAMGIFNEFNFTQWIFFKKNFIHIFFIGFPFIFVWGPAIYFYVKSIILNDEKVIQKSLIHFLPFFILFIFYLVSFAFRSVEYKIYILDSFAERFMDSAIILIHIMLFQVLFYNVASLQILKSYNDRLKENYSSINKKNISWLKFIILGYIISYAITLMVNYFPFLSELVRFDLRIIVFLSFFIYFNIIFFKGWQQPELFSGDEFVEKYKQSKLTENEANSLIPIIDEYIQVNKPQIESNLTLIQLSDKLNSNPRVLSQIINEYYGMNFYDFINKLRIEEAKKLLKEPSSNKTILEILYEVGFNSKSSFNHAFKKFNGITPSQFKKEHSQKEQLLQ